MPLPRALGRFNVRVTNRFLEPVVRHLPGFGVIEHRGRRSGRVYRTPVLAFRRGDRLTFAATYGPRSDWVRNIIANEGGAFERSGKRWRLSEPRAYRDPARRAVPRIVRPALALLRAADFLSVRAEADT